MGINRQEHTPAAALYCGRCYGYLVILPLCFLPQFPHQEKEDNGTGFGEKRGVRHLGMTAFVGSLGMLGFTASLSTLHLRSCPAPETKCLWPKEGGKSAFLVAFFCKLRVTL